MSYICLKHGVRDEPYCTWCRPRPGAATPDPSHDFTRGYAEALSDVNRRGIREAMSTLKMMIEAGELLPPSSDPRH